jgi:4-hydroxyphenylpyruvate dioxygenase
MGPYPRNAPPQSISDANPMGTDGFEFVEFTAPDTQELAATLRRLGFTAIARHRSKDVTLWRQGEINFVVNAERDSFAQAFARVHGPSACAMAFRVVDAAHAHRRAVELGAKPVEARVGPMELNIPAIEGIGGSLLYFVDRFGPKGTIWDVDFVPLEGHALDEQPSGIGFTVIDHLTHNVHRGRMDVWSEFYARLFNFREIRYFDIEGRLTGLKSRALTSPCGKIRIPINESAGNTDRVDQIEEYLKAYNGEGIQHIALGSDDILATVEAGRGLGAPFLPPPPATYYEKLDARLPGHGEDVARLQATGVLMDGAPTEDGGRLLQIFTQTMIGPIFFEVIQRKGDEGFGEGNFKALFESLEEDQIRRGVLKADAAR